MKFTLFTTAALLSTLVSAVPMAANAVNARDTDTTSSTSSASPAAISIVKTIAPTSDTCSGATYASECATADQITMPLIQSFATYSVSTPGEQAALLSWMAFESGDFKYNMNHFPAPGRPGQGSRTMMMPNFIKMYAESIKVAATGSDADILSAVLAVPGADVGSASWFLTTQCSEGVRSGLQKSGSGKAEWSAFITECVGTTMTDDREAYWTRSAKALGMSV